MKNKQVSLKDFLFCCLIIYLLHTQAHRALIGRLIAQMPRIAGAGVEAERQECKPSVPYGFESFLTIHEKHFRNPD